MGPHGGSRGGPGWKFSTGDNTERSEEIGAMKGFKGHTGWPEGGRGGKNGSPGGSRGVPDGNFQSATMPSAAR